MPSMWMYWKVPVRAIFKMWWRTWSWRHTSRTCSKAEVRLSQAFKWCDAISWNTRDKSTTFVLRLIYFVVRHVFHVAWTLHYTITVKHLHGVKEGILSLTICRLFGHIAPCSFPPVYFKIFIPWIHVTIIIKVHRAACLRLSTNVWQ